MSLCNEKKSYCMSKPLAYQLSDLSVIWHQSLMYHATVRQGYYNNDDNTNNKKKKKKRRNFLYILASLKNRAYKMLRLK